MSNKPKLKIKSPELYFIYGYYNMDENLYETVGRNDFTEGCSKVLFTYIGKVLDIDFEYFYKRNEESRKINERPEVKQEVVNKFGDWFMGDVLTNVIYDACYLKKMNEEKIEKALKYRYKWWKKILKKYSKKD